MPIMLDLEKQTEDEVVHELFDVSLLLKGLHALVEIAGGIFTFLISPNYIVRIITRITEGELAENPPDIFTHYLLNFLQSFSVGTKQFIAFYLLSHGIINLILVVGLFKKKMWAYHTSFIALTIFAIYQIYRYIYHHSIWLIIFTVLDFIMMWLIWKEYHRVKKSIGF